MRHYRIADEVYPEGNSYAREYGRLVVVIDPEDREQVSRLAQLLGWCMGSSDEGRLTAALREYADPKPPRCGAHVNITGEDFQCIESAGHGGWHRSPDAEAVWGDAQ